MLQFDLKFPAKSLMFVGSFKDSWNVDDEVLELHVVTFWLHSNDSIYSYRNGIVTCTMYAKLNSC